MDCTRKHTPSSPDALPASAAPPRCVSLRPASTSTPGSATPLTAISWSAPPRGELTPLILDVTDASHIAAAAGGITGHTEPTGLDGLVNNAGFGLACPTELVQLSAFRQQLEVNVTGQLAVTQAMLPSLRPDRDDQHDRGPLHPAVRRPAGCDQGRARRTRRHTAPGTSPWGIRVVLIEPASINSGAADKVSRAPPSSNATTPLQSRLHLARDSSRRHVRRRGQAPEHRGTGADARTAFPQAGELTSAIVPADPSWPLSSFSGSVSRR